MQDQDKIIDEDGQEIELGDVIEDEPEETVQRDEDDGEWED